MTCCGNLIEITTNDDRTPNYLCQECGKQGPKSAFPDPPEEAPPPVSLWTRVRWRIAEWIAPDSSTY